MRDFVQGASREPEFLKYFLLLLLSVLAINVSFHRLFLAWFQIILHKHFRKIALGSVDMLVFKFYLYKYY